MEQSPQFEEEALPAQATREHAFPCHNCGADLTFQPSQLELKCPYCGHSERIPQTEQEIAEYSYNDYLARPKKQGYADAGRNVRCSDCGASVHLDPSIRAQNCAFCSKPLITGETQDDVDSGDVIRPEGVIPFRIDKKQAQDKFKAWIQRLWFAPSRLKTDSNLGQFQGIYRPFWTYDAHSVSHWTGQRGDAYWDTESYTVRVNGNTERRTRRVRKIRWTSVSGVYRAFHDDVLVSAGKSTDFSTTWVLDGVVPYTPEYLSGFVAERYVVPLEDGWERGKKVIAGYIDAGIRRRIGGDEQRIHTCRTAYSGITYKHLLMPLWLNTYRFNNRVFQFQVNGQSGEVNGARPYSFWKIFLLVILVLALLGGILFTVTELQKDDRYEHDRSWHEQERLERAIRSNP